ncbi:MAG: hypothetical protein ABI190_06090 [Casimicrobiaceae bacterium]
MKRLIVAVIVIAVAGCIPIGFKAQTQSIAPPTSLQSMFGD